MTDALEESWYIVKQASQQCEIMTETDLRALPQQDESDKSKCAKWGPFETQNQAYAKRIGLIRAGKCQPK